MKGSDNDIRHLHSSHATTPEAPLRQTTNSPCPRRTWRMSGTLYMRIWYEMLKDPCCLSAIITTTDDAASIHRWVLMMVWVRRSVHVYYMRVHQRDYSVRPSLELTLIVQCHHTAVSCSAAFIWGYDEIVLHFQFSHSALMRMFSGAGHCTGATCNNR